MNGDEECLNRLIKEYKSRIFTQDFSPSTLNAKADNKMIITALEEKLKREKTESLYQSLLREIEYAKTSVFPQKSLYEVYGRIKMAFELKAITEEEYLNLNHECVAEGINNPKYFDN